MGFNPNIQLNDTVQQYQLIDYVELHWAQGDKCMLHGSCRHTLAYNARKALKILVEDAVDSI